LPVVIVPLVREFCRMLQYWVNVAVPSMEGFSTRSEV